MSRRPAPARRAPVNHPPFIKAPTPEQQQQLAGLDAKLQQADAWLKTRLPPTRPPAAWTSEGQMTATLLRRWRARPLSSFVHPIADSRQAPRQRSPGISLPKRAASPARPSPRQAIMSIWAAGDFDTKRVLLLRRLDQSRRWQWLAPFQDGKRRRLPRLGPVPVRRTPRRASYQHRGPPMR